MNEERGIKIPHVKVSQSDLKIYFEVEPNSPGTVAKQVVYDILRFYLLVKQSIWSCFIYVLFIFKIGHSLRFTISSTSSMNM